MFNILRLFMLLFVVGGLAACNNANQQPPVGIGPGINDLQRSPCACLEIPMSIPPHMV